MSKSFESLSDLMSSSVKDSSGVSEHHLAVPHSCAATADVFAARHKLSMSATGALANLGIISQTKNPTLSGN